MISVEHLSHYYGELAALDDVSFEIEAGQIVGLLGLNGAGKSTMLKILSGILLPTQGRVRIAGDEVVDGGERLRRRIGFLPDTPPLYPEMRVEEFLSWCGQVRGRSAAQVGEALPEVLETCQIAHVARTVIGELSHGYRKRVGIAQAIVHRPDLVLLDEPISGLDPVQIVEMRAVVRSLRDQATVLVSSHILSEVAQTCDHVVVLDRGRLRAVGAVDELLGRGVTRITFELSGAADTLVAVLQAHAEVVSDGDDAVAVRELGPGRYEVTSTLRADTTTEAVVAELVGAGVGVARVSPVRAELEALFVSGPWATPAEVDEEVSA